MSVLPSDHGLCGLPFPDHSSRTLWKGGHSFFANNMHATIVGPHEDHTCAMAVPGFRGRAPDPKLVAVVTSAPCYRGTESY